MSSELFQRARGGDAAAFGELVDPYRRELRLHCYRILGSIHDAEDAVQETLIAAWRGLGTYEGRSPVRAWLYRIATNRSLNMIRAAERREGAPPTMHDVPLPAPTHKAEVSWVEPYPDLLLEGIATSAPGPEALYELRESVSLAFITALQLLPPRQRAVLLLRDALGYRASEVAALLDVTVDSVESALKRARATLHEHLPLRDSAHLPTQRREHELVALFTEAFEANDIDAIVALLSADVVFSMPPMPFEWRGREAARAFLHAMAVPGRRVMATRANQQPAFVLYLPDARSGVLRAAGLLVLTVSDDGISAITRFENTVLRFFGMAPTREANA